MYYPFFRGKQFELLQSKSPQASLPTPASTRSSSQFEKPSAASIGCCRSSLRKEQRHP